MLLRNFGTITVGDDYPLVQDNVRVIIERYTYKDMPATAYNA